VLIKLATIDVSKPLQPIYVDARYASLFVWVCWGYVPLGMLRLQCESDTCTVSSERLQRAILHTFGWQLWEEAIAGALDRLEVHPDQSLPAISVVVCTRDRALSLQRCLQTLTQLDYPLYEVVVVDNCSRDASVPQIVADHGCRYVREDHPGLDWARNRGIREATHGIVAYIDDDALATPGWLRGVALGFADPEVMAVTGMVLPAEIETPAQYDFECYGGMSKGFKGYTIRRHELSPRDLLRAYNWGVGANMAFRRSLFETIGNFDVALDVGTPTNGAGDIEFFYRTVTAGYALRYEPAAMVYHVHRRDHGALTRQIYNNGRAFPAYLLTIIRNQPHCRRAILWFALRWWIWDWLLRRLLSSLMRRDRRTLRAALTELWGSCSALWAYRKSRKIALRQLQGRTVTGY
jgi:glycosyltransferase involved in cell wall biosynthesis